jgi:hypothetical protein
MYINKYNFFFARSLYETFESVLNSVRFTTLKNEIVEVKGSVLQKSLILECKKLEESTYVNQSLKNINPSKFNFTGLLKFRDMLFLLSHIAVLKNLTKLQVFIYVNIYMYMYTLFFVLLYLIIKYRSCISITIDIIVLISLWLILKTVCTFSVVLYSSKHHHNHHIPNFMPVIITFDIFMTFYSCLSRPGLCVLRS